jgi:hypothetical protein
VEPATAFTFNTTCVNVTEIKEPKTDIKYTVEVTPCGNKEMSCDVENPEQQHTAFWCSYYEAKDLVAGEKCRHDHECYSQECINSLCTGRGYNETCADDKHCDIGFSCQIKNYYEWDTKAKGVIDHQEKVCVPQITNPHTVCYSDEHCANNMGCFNERCIEYLSLDNGRPTDKALFCKSANAESGKCQDTELIVEDGKTNANFECLGTTNTCNYFIVGGKDTDKVPKQCVCSKSAEPKAYCPPDTKNSKFSNHTTSIKGAMVLDAHTTKRFDHSRLAKIDSFPEYEGTLDKVYDGLTYKATLMTSYIKAGVSCLLLATLLIA